VRRAAQLRPQPCANKSIWRLRICSGASFVWFVESLGRYIASGVVTIIIWMSNEALLFELFNILK
jgi:hypothetical protein